MAPSAVKDIITGMVINLDGFVAACDNSETAIDIVKALQFQEIDKFLEFRFLSMHYPEVVQFWKSAKMFAGIIKAKVNKKEIVISAEALAEHLGLPNEGITNFTDSIFREVSKEDFWAMIINDDTKLVNLSCYQSSLKLEFKHLHQMIEKSVEGKIGSFDLLTTFRAYVIAAIVLRHKIDWAQFVFNRLVEQVEKENSYEATPVNKTFHVKKSFGFMLSRLLPLMGVKMTSEAVVMKNSKIMFDNLKRKASESPVAMPPPKKSKNLQEGTSEGVSTEELDEALKSAQAFLSKPAPTTQNPALQSQLADVESWMLWKFGNSRSQMERLEDMVVIENWILNLMEKESVYDLIDTASLFDQVKKALMTRATSSADPPSPPGDDDEDDDDSDQESLAKKLEELKNKKTGKTPEKASDASEPSTSRSDKASEPQPAEHMSPVAEEPKDADGADGSKDTQAQETPSNPPPAEQEKESEPVKETGQTSTGADDGDHDDKDEEERKRKEKGKDVIDIEGSEDEEEKEKEKEKEKEREEEENASDSESEKLSFREMDEEEDLPSELEILKKIAAEKLDALTSEIQVQVQGMKSLCKHIEIEEQNSAISRGNILSKMVNIRKSVDTNYKTHTDHIFVLEDMIKTLKEEVTSNHKGILNMIDVKLEHMQAELATQLQMNRNELDNKINHLGTTMTRVLVNQETNSNLLFALLHDAKKGERPTGSSSGSRGVTPVSRGISMRMFDAFRNVRHNPEYTKLNRIDALLTWLRSQHPDNKMIVALELKQNQRGKENPVVAAQRFANAFVDGCFDCTLEEAWIEWQRLCNNPDLARISEATLRKTVKEAEDIRESRLGAV